MNDRTGSILVGLLWCLTLLSVIVIGVLHSATVHLRVTKNYGDVVQAHYLAVAGVEKAKALLYQDAMSRRRSSQNHGGQLYDLPQEFKEVRLGRGNFRVFHLAGNDEGGDVLYGISDEESRLNLNSASAEELAKLPGMTPDIVAAIVDWRDEDNAPTAGGAEAEYYASLQPPYVPRNGPLQTTRELLMVRGVNREQFGNDEANLNEIFAADEEEGRAPDLTQNRVLGPAWSGMVTVNSSVRDVNASGQARVELQSADESALTGVRGITAEIAKAIVAHRGRNRFESLADLLEVSAAVPGNPPAAPPSQTGVPSASGPGAPQARPAQNNAVSQPRGPKLISEDLLLEIADDVTASEGRGQAGAININAASPSVLACLQGITPELAQAIVSQRKSAGFFPNVAWLLRVPGMTREIFKQVAPRVCARSETFRILSEGEVPSSGARKRVQVIVRLGALDFETLSWGEAR